MESAMVELFVTVLLHRALCFLICYTL